MSPHTKEFLGARILNNLNNTRAQRLNRRNVIRQNTHITGLRRDIHLDNILGAEDGLRDLKPMLGQNPHALEKNTGGHRQTWWGSASESLSLSLTSA